MNPSHSVTGHFFLYQLRRYNYCSYLHREIRYTVLLNKKIPLPSDTRKEEEVSQSKSVVEILWIHRTVISNFIRELQSSLAPFVNKKESERETIFYINNLPKPGLYKAQIFARRRPKKRGKLIIPLVACILLEYRDVWKCFRNEYYCHTIMTSHVYP